MRSSRPEAIAAGSTSPAAATGRRRPRVALLGCGQWGANIARALAEAELLTGVCDADPGAAEATARRHGVAAFPGVDALLTSDCEGVVVATPAPTHAALACRALDAGKHVLVEKPFGLSVAEAVRMVERAGARGLVLMAGHLLRYHPAFERAAAMARRGEIGEILSVDSQRLGWGRVRAEENALWSLAPHDISMILHLLDGRPEVRSATGLGILRSGVLDGASVTLEFPGGAVAVAGVSWLHPRRVQSLSIVGSRGAIVFDDTLEWERKLAVFPDCLERDGAAWVARRRDPTYVQVDNVAPLARELLHFADCIVSGAVPRTGGEEALRVVEVLEAAQDELSRQAARRGAAARAAVDVHPTAVVDDGAIIGAGTRIWHFSHVSGGSRIGRDCVLGQNVMIGPGVSIGDRCKLQNNVSIYQGVTLEAEVFCGPSCVFTNVRNPRAHVDRKSEFRPTLVGRGSTIGANATVVCGTAIGHHAMVGAGAVVTRDVAPHALVVGNPARPVGWVSSAGERLGADLVCPRTGEKFRRSGEGIEREEGRPDGVQ